MNVNGQLFGLRPNVFLKHLLLDGMNVNGQLLGLRLTLFKNISYSVG